MECSNDSCFCDGSCYDDKFPTLGKTPETKITYSGDMSQIDETKWILNNRTIEN